MAVLSGKDGSVYIDGTVEAPVTDWTMETTSANDAYAANDTDGWKKRKGGVKDSSGSFNMKDLPSMLEGAEVEFVGYTNQDIVTQNVIIDRIRRVCDMNDGTIISWAVEFSGNGAVSQTTGSVGD